MNYNDNWLKETIQFIIDYVVINYSKLTQAIQH